MAEDFDRAVRIALYTRLSATGEAPTLAELAARLGSSAPEIQSSYERLAEQHVLVLDPETRALRMAPPFSAVPSAFRVKTPRASYWGNCLWDALGIPPMLGNGGQGTVESRCGDCGEPMEIEVAEGEIARGEGVWHVAVPAREWWKDIGYT
jgi:hypothetical protein